MYLSRIKIDTTNQNKIKDLTHLGAYHSWVEDSFPNEIKNHTRSRKLWRIDYLNHQPYLLIISSEKPDYNHLAKYGIKDSIQIMDYDKFTNKLKNGMQARFKMVLNPVYSKSSGKKSGKRGKIIPCLNYETRMEYLEKRALKNGFKLEKNNYTITHSSWDTLKKAGNQACTIQKMCYEGHLTIQDVDTFKYVLTHGLGKNKAYGCGLITIIPE